MASAGGEHAHDNDHRSRQSLGAMMLVPIAIMSALVARDRTGRGQHVEVSLLQGVLSLTTQNWNWTDRGQFLLPKTHPPTVHQSSIYECADGEWIHAAVWAGSTSTQSEASILGLEDVTLDDLVAMNAAQRDDYLDSVDTWDGETILFDDELVRLGLVAEYDHPLLGRVRQFGNLISFSDTPGVPERATPMLGEHTREVLTELGYDDDAIDDHRARGVVTWPDDDYAFPV